MRNDTLNEKIQTCIGTLTLIAEGNWRVTKVIDILHSMGDASARKDEVEVQNGQSKISGDQPVLIKTTSPATNTLIDWLRDFTREDSGGHSMTNTAGDKLWFIRNPLNLTKLAAAITQFYKGGVCSEIWVIAGDEAIEEALLTLRPTVWKDVEQQVVIGELPAAQLPMKVEQWMENFRPYLKRAIEVYLKSTKREISERETHLENRLQAILLVYKHNDTAGIDMMAQIAIEALKGIDRFSELLSQFGKHGTYGKTVRTEGKLPYKTEIEVREGGK